MTIHGPGPADVQVTVVQAGRVEHERPLTHDLIEALRQAGHHVHEQPWRSVVRPGQPGGAVSDLVLLLESGASALPGQLAVARSSRGAGDSTPAVVLIALDSPAPANAVDAVLRRRLFAAVDAVVTHTADAGERARALGAADVSVVRSPAGPVLEDEELTPEWVDYVARIETIAARAAVHGTGPHDPGRDAVPPGAAAHPRPGTPPPATLRDRARAAGSLAATTARSLARGRRGHLDLGFRDLPEWVRPTDVLTSDIDAREVLTLARDLGLPWTRHRAAASQRSPLPASHP